jgi:hypothetical protein
MRIINPQWTNLSKGYQAARDLEQQALRNWEAKWAQSVEFARQQGIKRAAESIQVQIASEKKTLRLILILLAGVILLMAVVTSLLQRFPNLQWFLIPAGVINFLQAAVLLLPILDKLRKISVLGSTQPEPEQPGTSLEIAEQWWQSVSSRAPSQPTGEAGLGEFSFLRYLSENLPNDYIAVQSLLVKQSLDVDVLLIGPTGIWLFEVKNWRGRVTLHNGIWKHEAAPGETPDDPSRPFDDAQDKPSDAQWLDERETVEKTLNLRLARNARFGTLLRGGLVFTHPNVQLEMDGSSKVEVGTPPQWLRRIRSTAKMAQFSTEVQLLVLDVLLDYALSLYVTRPLVKSAVELAKLLYGDVLEDLRRYILRQVRSRVAEGQID